MELFVTFKQSSSPRVYRVGDDRLPSPIIHVDVLHGLLAAPDKAFKRLDCCSALRLSL
jgi:hypothetical protein